MSLRRTLMWLTVAPLGLGLTTGLTITTTLLTQQPIGLGSEPLSAGDALAPRAAKAVATGVRGQAAKPPPAPLPHGGRALSIAIPRESRTSVTPDVTPQPPVPAPATTATTALVPATHASSAKQAASTRQPGTTKQPTPTKKATPTTTPTHVDTQSDERGGGGPQPSSDGAPSADGGSDGSGQGTRDD